MTRRIGLYFGTFDPIHVGHSTFARDVKAALNLDFVLFLPEQQPYGKLAVTPLAQRLAAIRRHLHGDMDMGVQTLRHAPITVAGVLSELAPLFQDNHVVLLMGSDVAHGLASWPDIDLLLARCDLCIGLREHDTIESLQPVIEDLHTICDTAPTITYVRSQHPFVSSGRIRRKLLEETKL